MNKEEQLMQHGSGLRRNINRCHPLSLDNETCQLPIGTDNNDSVRTTNVNRPIFSKNKQGVACSSLTV